MKKTQICLVSLAIAMFTLFVGVGCSDSSREAKEIDKVLSKSIDILNSKNCTNDKEYRDWLNYATLQMRRIDTSNCPQDFCYAYECYAHSWENLLLAERKRAGEEGLLKQIASNMLPSPVTKAMDQRDNAIRNINKVAKRHGARKRIRIVYYIGSTPRTIE